MLRIERICIPVESMNSQHIHLKCHQQNVDEAKGYASIDKPYNRFYAPREQWVSIPKKTIY